jgi:DNA-binding transcriptional LysR family regulator
MKIGQQLDLDAVRIFAAVVEGGGFTAGAGRLGITKARASLDVARLERQLGVSLLTRTTRRVTLTDPGQKLYSECVPALRQVESLAAQLRSDSDRLTGRLRLTATVDHAANSLARAVAVFSARHPALQIEVITTDATLDLVADGIDVAIRLGWLRNSSLRATKLAEFEQFVLGSPEYLARAGTPTKPEDLADHAWIALMRLSTPFTWTFRAASGNARIVRVRAKLRVDTAMTLRILLESGAGIAALDSISCAEAMRIGKLRRVLSRWTLPKGGIYAVCPPGVHTPAPSRAFIDFYRNFLTTDAR